MKTRPLVRAPRPHARVARHLIRYALFSTLALGVALPAAAEMLGLGPVPGAPGRDVQLQGISADGTTVVGQAGNLWDTQLFSWALFRGHRKIGPVFSRPFSYAYATDKNGHVIVGSAPLKPGSTDLHAFAWTNEEGFNDLGTLGGASSGAYAISAGDGRRRNHAVAGFADNVNGTQRAFRWTQASGMLDLGSLPGSDRSFAFGISGDGQVVVGFTGIIDNNSKAFRWDVASSTMIDLGSLGSSSVAYATNHDGSVVVGYSYRYLRDLSVRETAFRWTAATGLQAIGRLSDDDSTRSVAKSVNGDDTVVVGKRGGRAFRWTVAEGLTNLGTLPGDTYSEATGVSKNGRVVVGRSMNAHFVSRAFIWTAGANPIQDMTELQSSLIRSAHSVTRSVRGAPYHLPLQNPHPVAASHAEITLSCAARLTTACGAQPQWSPRAEQALALQLATR